VKRTGNSSPGKHTVFESVISDVHLSGYELKIFDNGTRNVDIGEIPQKKPSVGQDISSIQCLLLLLVIPHSMRGPVEVSGGRRSGK
jgi:hypothetical protein